VFSTVSRVSSVCQGASDGLSRPVTPYASPRRAGVQALGVACLAYFQRRIYKDFNELVRPDQVAHFVARGAVRVDCRANRDTGICWVQALGHTSCFAVLVQAHQ
jgi:hypothetical protein